MEKNNNKPKLRFPGFTDTWEQCKLGDLSESFEYGLNAAAMDFDGKNKYIRITDIDDESREFLNTGLTSPNIDLSRAENFKLQNGDIVFARTGASVGKSYIYKSSDGVLYYAGFLIRARIKPQYSAEFVFQNTFTTDYNKFIRITSQRSGQPGVNAQEYSEYVLKVPKFEEQTKIGTFFHNIDNLINLHQRKLNHLRDKKKSLLQKMFPQNGEEFPELRFPGFTDPWEQRKVGELIEDYIEKTEIQNQYPVLTSSQQKGIVLQEDYFADRQVTTNDNIGYFVLPKGYFTYRSRSDTNLFVFNRNDLINKGIISYYYPVFCVKDTDSNFFLRRINFGMNSQLAMAAEGTGQHVLSQSKFKNMITIVPTLPEQKQIGLLFEQLDNLITLHGRKLNHLKEQKKALLQQMFI